MASRCSRACSRQSTSSEFNASVSSNFNSVFLKATMVLADGSIVTASEKENSDLFWGIRGGGCNFGICMEFALQLHEQRATVYSGILNYPAPLADKIFEITERWRDNNSDPNCCLVQGLTRGPSPECEVGFCYFLPASSNLISANYSHALLLSLSIMVPQKRVEKSSRIFWTFVGISEQTLMTRDGSNEFQAHPTGPEKCPTKK